MSAELVLPVEPILAAGNVLIAEDTPVPDGNGAKQWELALVSIETGKKTWSVPLPDIIRAAAAVGDTLVIATDHAIGAVALATGELKWSGPLNGMRDNGGAAIPGFEDPRWLGRPLPPTNNVGRFLLVVDDAVALHVGQSLVCVEAATGEARWEQRLEPNRGDPLTLHGGRILVPTTAAGLLAVDPASGDQVWAAPLGKVSRVECFDKAIYCGEMDQVAKLDPESGSVLWVTEQLRTKSANLGDPKERWLTPSGDKLIVRHSRAVAILDDTKGTLLWVADTEGHASAVDRNCIYYTPSADMTVVAFDVPAMKEIWRSEPLGDTPLSLICDGDMIVAVLAHSMVGLNRSDGVKKWEWATEPLDLGIWKDNAFARDARVFARGEKWAAAVNVADGTTYFHALGQFFFCSWLDVRAKTFLLHSRGPDKTVLYAYKLPG